MKKTFIFYNDWIDYTEEMTQQEKWLLLEAILAYQNWLELPDMWNIKFVWSRIKKQLDIDNEKRKDEIEKRKMAGKMWGKAKASKSKQVLASASKWKQLLADNVNVTVNDNVNVNETDIKDNAIALEQAPIYWDNDVNNILEKIKMYNNWIIDWTVKEQRQYWKMLFNKISKIETVANWKYTADWLLEIILKIISWNEYHSHKIVWPKKIYYELAGLMQICKQEIQKEKGKTAKEF